MTHQQVVGVPAYPRTSLGTKAMCVGSNEGRPQTRARGGVKEACPGQPHHRGPRQLWGQRVAPRWLIHGEELAMFRALQSAVTLHLFRASLVNSTLAPFFILLPPVSVPRFPHL